MKTDRLKFDSQTDLRWADIKRGGAWEDGTRYEESG